MSLPLIGAVTGLVLVPVAWTAGWLADGGCPVMFHWASGIPIGWMGVLTALVGAAAFACAGRVIAATVRRGWRAVWAAAIAVAAAVAPEATVPGI